MRAIAIVTVIALIAGCGSLPTHTRDGQRICKPNEPLGRNGCVEIYQGGCRPVVNDDGDIRKCH